MSCKQGWSQDFPHGGRADSSDRGLKYGFQGTSNAKQYPKNSFWPSEGASVFQRGAIAP